MPEDLTQTQQPGDLATGASDSATATRILEVDNVTLRFGGVVALNEVSFHINEGEILGLIGPNGAGKTTCFNVMTGVYQPTSGAVRFQGEPLGRRKRFEITKLGIARTFQNIRLFGNMTALENVMVGADTHHRTGVLSAMFRLPRHRVEEAEGRARAEELLEFMGLDQGVRTSWRATCRTATSVASRSPARWPPGPSSCAWTSRRPASTRPRRPS